MPQVELVDGVASLPRRAWNELVGAGSPFLEWDWLVSLERAGCVGGETGWQARPLVVREGDRLLAACPLYVKAHSEGEFVFDWSWADAAQRAGIRYYPKLLVGVPFTPVSGSRFLTAPGEQRAAWILRLADALREICRQSGLSGAHVNFCLEDETRPLEGSDFRLRLGIQYHWRNHGYSSFEDYLAAFRSKRRNQIRRERRGVAEAGVSVEVVSGDAIGDELFEPMYRCYLSTVEARYWGRQYLNPRFFELLREHFRERLCFVVARRNGEILAGTTNVVKGDAFYGRYWGALQPQRFLHFDVCYYRAIEFCIEHGLQRFEPGAGGDYKWLRGFDATPTYSLHYLTEPSLAAAVNRFLESERQEARRVLAELDSESPIRRGRSARSRPPPR